LFRVPDSGGAAETLIQVDPNEGERLFLLPQALPDGKSILFTATVSWDSSDAVLLSLETASRRTVIENAVNARYVPTGQVLFVRGGALWAVDFDLARLEKVGTERPVLSGVEQRGWASIAFSETGLLVYVPGEEGAWVEETVAWVSRDGQRTPVTSERLDYQWLRLSPSGDKIALSTLDALKPASDVWILDLESERQERVTFHEGRDRSPIWTPDGRSLIFASDRDGRSLQLYRQSVVESGEAELLLESDEDLTPLDVSPDGRALAFRQSQDIYLLSLQDQSVSPLVATDASEVFAKFSPDGRFLAYVSDETGQREMYVQPYPPTGGKWQVSRGGANDAVWAADGNELYYLRGTTMVAVRVQLSPGFEVLGERELFEAPPTNTGRSFDVHPSSGRFLFIDKTIESPPQFVNVVTNFFDLLTPGEGQ
jgi:dipeptidyl aminopeptidase/acylaminoacyl peptidase